MISHLGALIAAYVGNLNGHSSNQAEVMDLAYGIHIALSMGIRIMDIEGDSILIINVVKGKNKLNWTIEGTIRDTMRLISRLDSFRVMHIYRESNRVVNSMATIDLNLSGLRCWRSHKSVPDHIPLDEVVTCSTRMEMTQTLLLAFHLGLQSHDEVQMGWKRVGCHQYLLALNAS
ncbi:uncharacterized protein LOC131874150 [Cryptomeria japonica]|uniref:uncharacterized protein LOC131874150 n=1 Tax=Cryptomeria japonica TaxID=3369 RepID=UPI0027D9E044|nr:uncharacterized protein LOC131874150 [Cryptomeria japonica]